MTGDIVSPLLAWYGKNARTLPWREDPTAYHVWVSEIMLQQTRVETVIPYYERFIGALPDPANLAEAQEPFLLKLWEGLGYYSRIRNMQKAAQIIMRQYGGEIPNSYDELVSLPGIGAYTAGAICSIAFNMPVPAVDGNVLRVFSRLTRCPEDMGKDMAKRRVFRRLRGIYPAGKCGDFTQSLMELGATVCLPTGRPRCFDCPVSHFCMSHMDGTELQFPKTMPKAPRRKEALTVFLLICQDQIALSMRADKGLLAGQWEFPNEIGALDDAACQNWLRAHDVAVARQEPPANCRHIFTHVQWDMIKRVVYCENTPTNFLWKSFEELDSSIALPTAFRKLLADVPMNLIKRSK